MGVIRLSMLAGQNLWLRLLTLVLAIIIIVSGSFRQVGSTLILFFLFLFLDITLFAMLSKGIRVSLPFLAGYWIFATIFNAGFTDMLLFSLRLLSLVIATVFCLGNVTLERVLADTRLLRKYHWGSVIVHYSLATVMFVGAYSRYFAKHRLKAGNNLGVVLDEIIHAGKHVFRLSGHIEKQMEASIQSTQQPLPYSTGNYILLILMALLVVVSSV
jgi:hypothetical protein